MDLLDSSTEVTFTEVTLTEVTLTEVTLTEVTLTPSDPDPMTQMTQQQIL